LDPLTTDLDLQTTELDSLTKVLVFPTT